MGYRHCCVIDEQGNYITLVRIVDDTVQGYALQDGERLIDAVLPVGYIKPVWSGGYWKDQATPEEIFSAGALILLDLKAAKIANSKTQLATYLETHPLTYTDGKRYSVTAEKQSLLTSALARHQIAASAAVTTELKWNATGEECTVWEYADLAALALAIADYVEPLVAQQQAVEVAINACTTMAEVEAIVIAYGS